MQAQGAVKKGGAAQGARAQEAENSSGYGAGKRALQRSRGANMPAVRERGAETNAPNQNYLDYMHSFAAPTKHFHNCLRAYIVGGGICCVGQFIRIMLENWAHLSGDELAGTVSAVLIFLGCLLTGLGVYDRIGKAAGAGSIVPITGFANSVASPALEFKAEGFITGLAAKMFVVAGPIIVYGVLSGAAVGLIYWLLSL